MTARGKIAIGLAVALAAITVPVATAATADEDTAAPRATYALPIPQDALPRDEYDDPHHDYPAIDLPTPTGTDAYAVTSGQAVVFTDSGCGNGVELTGDDGALYTYCHFDSHAIGSGPVQPGQLLGATGNTGNSTGPHLHFQIKTDGTLRCPQNMLLAIFDGQAPPAPTDLPTSGCSNLAAPQLDHLPHG
jgi:murein DD-endopeptidase MepM/ murein hydrolase activator NlpD